MRNLKGFTLIELMIVMVIIGILLSLLLPGVFTGRQSAIQTQCASNLRQVAVGLYAYAKDNSGSLPATLATLNTDGYIDTTAVFECPKTTTAYDFDAASTNLYGMSSSGVLAECDQATDSNNHEISVYADGHVE